MGTNEASILHTVITAIDNALVAYNYNSRTCSYWDTNSGASSWRVTPETHNGGWFPTHRTRYSLSLPSVYLILWSAQTSETGVFEAILGSFRKSLDVAKEVLCGGFGGGGSTDSYTSKVTCRLLKICACISLKMHHSGDTMYGVICLSWWSVTQLFLDQKHINGSWLNYKWHSISTAS